MNDLALLPEALTPAVVYGEGGASRILDEIAKQARAEAHDVETAKGRAAIASIAFKVARSKTALDDMGKALVADWKLRATAVDAERRRIRETLDALKDEVRAPLTAWEAEQERQKAARVERVEQIRRMSTIDDRSIDALKRRVADIKSVVISADIYGDMVGAAAIAKDEALTAVERLLDAALADQERRVAAEKEAAERAERERIASLERAKREAERIAREAAAKAERDAAEAAEQAKRQKAADEARERQRIEDAERRTREAVEAERRRVAAGAAAMEAAEAKRAADQAHRRKINNAALAAIVGLGASEDIAKAIVLAIVSGDVPHVSIRY